MSSMTCTHGALDATLLPAALTEVAEQSFFAYVDPCPAAELEPHWPPGNAWLYAVVEFGREQHRGRVELALPSGLAGDLAAAFAGTDVGELSDAMVGDVVGELCNMVCGLWLTRAIPSVWFALAPPLVEVGLPPLPQGWTFMAINDVAAGFRVREDR